MSVEESQRVAEKLKYDVQTGLSFGDTSPDLTLNGGLHREKYHNGLKLGGGIILNYPGF